MEPTSSTSPFSSAFYPVHIYPEKMSESFFSLVDLYFFTWFMNFSWVCWSFVLRNYLSYSVQSLNGLKISDKSLLNYQIYYSFDWRLLFSRVVWSKNPLSIILFTRTPILPTILFLSEITWSPIDKTKYPPLAATSPAKV